MSSERTAEIRKAIKAEFPDYKFSIINEHHSGIRIAILSGPLQLLSPDHLERGREQVNEYYIREHFAERPETSKILLRIKEIANEGNGTESTDGDYGNIPHFYLTIEIGKWDEAYKVIERGRLTPRIEGVPPTGDKIATCKLNQAKGGVELYFPANPGRAVLDDLTVNRFRWSRFNKCWYAKDNSIARKVAEKYATIPVEEEAKIAIPGF